jgi:hypothetical protein
MTTMNVLSEKYEQVRTNVNQCLTEISDIKLSHPKGNQQMEELVGKLEAIRANFDKELDFLENNSEWEKFTIAFFGETNAGKSTIIETLRIIFDEQSRKFELEQQGADMVKVEAAYTEKAEALLLILKGNYDGYAASTATIADDLSRLAIQFRELKRRWLVYIGVSGALALLLGNVFSHFGLDFLALMHRV